MIKSRKMSCAGHVTRMGEKWNACRILVGKPEGKEPLERTRCRLVDNMKMDLRKIAWDGVDWIYLSLGYRVVERSCEHGNKPSGYIQFWEVLEWLHN
jgi:hypothetical protein